MTRSTLNGDPRCDRFSSLQVKAVIIHRAMRRLGFHSSIRRFAIPADCIVPPDSDELAQIGIHDIDDLINCFREMSVALSNDRPTDGYVVGLLFLENFSCLPDALCHMGYLESIYESGLLLGGVMTNRLLIRPSLGAKTEHSDDCYFGSMADE
jgi:hypothetical protein